ncbi:MAG: hypothetical protein WDM87_16110 [Terracidiphilus sp.]
MEPPTIVSDAAAGLPVSKRVGELAEWGLSAVMESGSLIAFCEEGAEGLKGQCVSGAQ